MRRIEAGSRPDVQSDPRNRDQRRPDRAGRPLASGPQPPRTALPRELQRMGEAAVFLHRHARHHQIPAAPPGPTGEEAVWALLGRRPHTDPVPLRPGSGEGTDDAEQHRDDPPPGTTRHAPWVRRVAQGGGSPQPRRSPLPRKGGRA